MIIHDKYIDEINNILQGKGVEKTVFVNTNWKLLDKSDYLLDSETAVELGTTNIQSLSMSLFSSNMKFEDKIVVIGDDIKKLKGKNPYFAKIVFVSLKEESDENKVYTNIKEISRTRFNLNLEGTMSKGTSIENRECIRISKNAYKKGFNFSILGSALINKMKENENVLNVQVYYIVNNEKLIDEFRHIPKTINLITGAFNNIFGDLEMDCGSCIIKDVCDEVEGMRDEHKKQKEMIQK